MSELPAPHTWSPEDVGKIAAKVQAAAWKAGYDTAKAETLADLRAKVEALPRDAHARHDDLIPRRQVLALLDGDSE